MHIDLLNQGVWAWVIAVGFWGGVILAFVGIFRFSWFVMGAGLLILLGVIGGTFALSNQDHQTFTNAVQAHYGITLTGQNAQELLDVHQGAFQPAPRVETQAGTAYVYGTSTIHVGDKTERATLYKLNDKFVLGLANPTNDLRELPTK